MGSGIQKISDIELLNDETVDLALNVEVSPPTGKTKNLDAVFMTNLRIIKIGTSKGKKPGVFSSLDDIDAVSVVEDDIGIRGYAWGLLSFAASIISWHMWDHPIGSPTGSLALLLMGVYLIVDHKLSIRRLKILFETNSGTIEYLAGPMANTQHIYNFVNRMFNLKEINKTKLIGNRPKGRNIRTANHRVFAPR